VNSSGGGDASRPGCELGGSSSLLSLVDVADGYERWAPTYDCFPNPLLSREERHVAPLLPTLRNRRVLDLACGTGRWLTRLLGAGARSVVGIDLSSAMLRVAAHKKELSGSVVQADCLKLPFRASTFDFAICSFALGHIRDLRSAAAEMAQVMKPDSDLFVADLHLEAFARGWRTGFRDRQGAVQIESQPYSVENIIRAFHSGGFSCVTHVGLCLGNPEQPIFAGTGRQHLFQAACRAPAILFCHFKRVRYRQHSTEDHEQTRASRKLGPPRG
jgi:ubiquinone/menaquinone biosynthesis C-methylase UbiE